MSFKIFSRVFAVLVSLLLMESNLVGVEVPSVTEAVIEGKDFRISVPDGWQVLENYEGASLFIEAPLTDGSAYRRNMRIMAFSAPVFVDTFSLETMADKISRGVSESSNSIRDYQMTNKMLMDFDSGLRGLLYYGDFTMLGVPMMQMHLVVSSADNHFILAYTDLKENFDFDNSPFLDQAFSTMGSIVMETKAPERFVFIKIFGLLAAGLISLGLFIRYMMNRRTKILTEFFSDTDIENDSYDELGDEADVVAVDRSVEDELIKSISGSRKLLSVPSWLKRSKYDDDEHDFEEDEQFEASAELDGIEVAENDRAI